MKFLLNNLQNQAVTEGSAEDNVSSKVQIDLKVPQLYANDILHNDNKKNIGKVESNITFENDKNYQYIVDSSKNTLGEIINCPKESIKHVPQSVLDNTVLAKDIESKQKIQKHKKHVARKGFNFRQMKMEIFQSLVKHLDRMIGYKYVNTLPKRRRYKRHSIEFRYIRKLQMLRWKQLREFYLSSTDTDSDYSKRFKRVRRKHKNKKPVEEKSEENISDDYIRRIFREQRDYDNIISKYKEFEEFYHTFIETDTEGCKSQTVPEITASVCEEKSLVKIGLSKNDVNSGDSGYIKSDLDDSDSTTSYKKRKACDSEHIEAPASKKKFTLVRNLDIDNCDDRCNNTVDKIVSTPSVTELNQSLESNKSKSCMAINHLKSSEHCEDQEDQDNSTMQHLFGSECETVCSNSEENEKYEVRETVNVNRNTKCIKSLENNDSVSGKTETLSETCYTNKSALLGVDVLHANETPSTKCNTVCSRRKSNVKSCQVQENVEMKEEKQEIVPLLPNIAQSGNYITENHLKSFKSCENENTISSSIINLLGFESGSPRSSSEETEKGDVRKTVEVNPNIELMQTLEKNESDCGKIVKSGSQRSENLPEACTNNIVILGKDILHTDKNSSTNRNTIRSRRKSNVKSCQFEEDIEMKEEKQATFPLLRSSDPGDSCTTNNLNLSECCENKNSSMQYLFGSDCESVCSSINMNVIRKVKTRATVKRNTKRKRNMARNCDTEENDSIRYLFGSDCESVCSSVAVNECSESHIETVEDLPKTSTTNIVSKVKNINKLATPKCKRIQTRKNNKMSHVQEDAQINKEQLTPIDALHLRLCEESLTDVTRKSNVVRTTYKRSNLLKPHLQVQTEVNSTTCPVQIKEHVETLETCPVSAEQVKQLSKEQARILLKKILTFPDKPAIVDEVAAVFSNQDNNHIARLIIMELSFDTFDKPDIKHTPPAPVMTETQRILLAFLVKLDGSSSQGVVDTFMTEAERYLLSLKNIECLESATRLYLAVCKLQKRVHRMRRMVCDAFYFMGDLSIPFLFTVLSTWIEVLPSQSETLSDPLVNVIIEVVKQKACITPGYNLIPLKKLLNQYYGYGMEERCVNELFTQMFNKYAESQTKSLEYAMIILCKNLSPIWVLERINVYMKPILESSTDVGLRENVTKLVKAITERFK